MKKAKRILALIMAVMIVFTSQTTLLAQELTSTQIYEEDFKNTLRGSEEFVAKYPYGRFNLLTPRVETSEDLSSIELVVVREGGTSGQALVDFKVTDITAEYGVDYYIAQGSKKIEKQHEEAPLISTINEVNNEANIEQTENVTTGSSLEIEEQKELPKNSGLRAVRESYTNTKSDRLDWKEADAQQKEIAQDVNNDFFEKLPGTDVTLTFEEGEYKKSLYFVTIKSDVAKGERQVLMTLTNPVNAVLGELSNGYVNIKASAIKEELVFEMEKPLIEVSKEGSYAEVVVKRTAGIYQYGTVLVRTGAGTAQPDIDYTSMTQEVVFVPGVEEQIVRIPLVNPPSSVEDCKFTVYLEDEGRYSFGNRQTEVLLVNKPVISPNASISAASISPASSDPFVKEIYGSFDNFGVSTVNYRRGADKVIVSQSTGEINVWSDDSAAMDLSGVDKLSIDFSVTGSTSRKNPGCNNGYYYSRNYNTYVSLYSGNDVETIFTQNGGEVSGTKEFTIPSKYKGNGKKYQIHIKVVTNNDNARLEINNMKVYYTKFNVSIQNDPTDSDYKINTKKIVGINSNTKELMVESTATIEPSFMQIVQNNTNGIYSKDIKVNEKVSFDMQFRDAYKANKDDMYLWGFKVWTKGTGDGNSNEYMNIPGSTLDLSEQWLSANFKKITGDGNSKNILVRPIFKQKMSVVKLNVETEKGYINNFANNDVLIMGRLDTLQLTGIAKTGYFVNGYTGKYSETEGIRESDLVKMYDSWDKNAYNNTGASVSKITNWQSSGTFPLNVSVPNQLIFSPKNRFTNVTAIFSEPHLNVNIVPESKRDTRYDKVGAVVYSYEDENGENKTISTVEEKDGNRLYNIPIVLKPETGKTYSFTAVTEDGTDAEQYIAGWMDFTGDINKDGEISSEEKKQLAPFGDLVNRNIVYGNVYNYTPVLENPLIYYRFEPVYKSGYIGKISGQVFLTGGTILKRITDKNQMIRTATPIVGAEISLADKVLMTDDSGSFTHTSFLFPVHKLQSALVKYKGARMTAFVQESVDTDIYINSFDQFDISNFKIYKNNIELKPSEILNEDISHNFQFTAKSNIPNLDAAKARVRVYSPSKQILVNEVVEKKDGLFSLNINPASKQVPPGSTMTITIIDQNGIEYFENEVGFEYGKTLPIINISSIMKTPGGPVLEFIGATKFVANMGLTGDIQSANSPLAKYTSRDDNSNVTINVGFSFDKSGDGPFTSSAKKKKEIEETSKGTSTDDEVKKVSQDGVNDNALPKQGSFKESYNFNIKTSINLVLNYDKTTKEYYFHEMIISASFEGEYSIRYDYMTPIGIPVFVTAKTSGLLAGSFVVEEYGTNKHYLNDYGLIDVTNFVVDPSKQDRNANMYGLFKVNPIITLGAGVGFHVGEVELSGTAAFKMDFATFGTGKGNVTLSANLRLKILFITKKWELVSKEYEMFNYGLQNVMYQMFGEDSYLYDPISSFEDVPRNYAPARSANMFAAFSNSNQEIKTGVYPNTKSKMVDLGNGKMLLVFLDDDSTRPDNDRTAVYYTVFNGDSWTIPAQVDDDGTYDQDPTVYALGNGKAIIAWASADLAVPNGEALDKQLSRLNIKCVEYDNDGTLGSVQDVTETTTGFTGVDNELYADKYSDTQPQIAQDQTGKLIMYYTKTEYENGIDTTSGAALVVGDILNAYSVITARTFDGSNWVADYKPTEDSKIRNSGAVNGDPIAHGKYLDTFYGQRFLELAPRYIIDDSDILITEENKTDTNNMVGRWMDGTMPIIKPAVGNTDPRVLESAVISYNNFSLFAYVLDNDANLETSGDQEIYMQIYNFNDDSFTHPISVTRNTVKDGNIQFVRDNDTTYLYWLENGNIVRGDMSAMVKAGLILGTTQGGQNFYYVDNHQSSWYSGSEIIVEQKENLPIDNFKVSVTGDGSNSVTYVVWEEFLTNSDDTALPENQMNEKQLFGVSIKEEKKNAQTDNGTTFSYNRITSKSLPVQITKDEGMGVSNVTAIPNINGGLQLVYNMYETSETQNQSLVSVQYNPTSELVFTKEFAMNEKVLTDNANIVLSASLANLGMEDATNVSYKFYYMEGGTKKAIEEGNTNAEGIVLGGQNVDIQTLWNVPYETENITAVGLEILKGGSSILSKDIDLVPTENIAISDFELEQTTTRGLYTAKALLTNNGSKDATNSIIKLSTDNINMEDRVNIPRGQSILWELDFTLPNSDFTETNTEDGWYFESAIVNLISVGDDDIATIERSASEDSIAAIEEIIAANLKGTDTFTVGESANLALDITSNLGTPVGYTVLWETNNQEVLNVLPEGAMIATKVGSTQVKAYVIPEESNAYMISSSHMPVKIDTLLGLPEKAIKTFTFNINVTDGYSINVQTEGGGTAYATPSSAKQGVEVSLTATPNTNYIFSGWQVIKPANLTITNNKFIMPNESAVVKAKFAYVGENNDNDSDSQGSSISTINTFTEKVIPAAKGSFYTKEQVEKLDYHITIVGADIELPRDFFSKTGFGLVYFDYSNKVFEIYGANKENKLLDFKDLSGINIKLSNELLPQQKPEFLTLFNETTDKTVVLSKFDGKNLVANINSSGKYSIAYKQKAFTDTKGYFYDNVVGFLASRDVIAGINENEFGGQMQVTRGQFVTLLMRMLGLENVEISNNSVATFQDVSKDSSYYKAITNAQKLGLISGTGENLFSPEAKITREDMFTITDKVLLKLKLIDNKQATLSFDDRDQVAEYAVGALSRLYSNKLFAGYDNRINPKNNTTRGEAAQVLYNIWEYVWQKNNEEGEEE